MINYRNGKNKYKVNELGSLYIEDSKVISHEQSVIYIGGQMSHHGHILEQSGFTMDSNHNLYTGSWMFDYPIFTNNKSSINAKNFSENLIESLKQAKLNDVILLTHSHGGLIGAYASQSELIDKVISIHPPILGTPLSNYEYLEKYKELLNNAQKLIIKFIKYMINYEFGFAQDNFNGVDLNKVDLNKLLVIGSFLDIDLEKNKLLLETYDIIEKTTGKRSDGIVTFEPAEFDKLGINYIQNEENLNHFNSMNPDVFKKSLNRVLNKNLK